MDNYFSKIKKIISEQCGVSENLINSSAKLTTDLNLSELEISDLLVTLSKEFKFQLPEELNLSTIETIDDIINLIEQHTQEL